jgi:hypothetical protein
MSTNGLWSKPANRHHHSGPGSFEDIDAIYLVGFDGRRQEGAEARISASSLSRSGLGRRQSSMPFGGG